MDSIVLETASVSGTFSSSMTVMPESLSALAATAWAWFQPQSSRGPHIDEADRGGGVGRQHTRGEQGAGSSSAKKAAAGEI